MSPGDLQSELAALNMLGIQALGDRWTAAFGSTPPTGCKPILLRRALGWHLQASAAAGKAVKVERMLRVERPVADRLSPGTRLVREWQGRTHYVTVLPDGRFEYQDQPYRSLTAIARAITGTAWSGPLFFGLR